jgi:hypothetical protein
MRVKIQIHWCTNCLVCGERLGFLRHLTGKKFCTPEHQEQYLAELRGVEFTRLRDAGEASRTDSTIR